MLFQAEIWESLSLPAFCLLDGDLSIFMYDKKTDCYLPEKTVYFCRS